MLDAICSSCGYDCERSKAKIKMVRNASSEFERITCSACQSKIEQRIKKPGKKAKPKEMYEDSNFEDQQFAEDYVRKNGYV